MKNFPEKKIAQNCARGPQTQSEFFRSREGQGRVDDFAAYIINHMTYICEGEEEEMGEKRHWKP